MEQRRCIVPSDGFYEWQRTGGPKQPYFLHPPERAVLAMAGVWAVWKEPGVRAVGALGGGHHHGGQLLPREAWDDWLDPAMDDPEYIQSLLVPAPDDVLDIYPISRGSNVRNQGPELLESVAEPPGLGLED